MAASHLYESHEYCTVLYCPFSLRILRATNDRPRGGRRDELPSRLYHIDERATRRRKICTNRCRSQKDHVIVLLIVITLASGSAYELR